MTTVEVNTTGKTIAVASPYHPDFPKKARKIGGKWDGAAKVWVFDPRDERRVRELCKEVFGTDGTPVELVTMRVTYAQRQAAHRDAIWLAGRQVAQARGRDSGARLGEGVVIIEGSAYSSGSVKNWETAIAEGTVLEIRDVPRDIAEREAANPDPGVSIEIVQEGDAREALEAEAAQLRARLAEIEAQLSKMDPKPKAAPVASEEKAEASAPAPTTVDDVRAMLK